MSVLFLLLATAVAPPTAAAALSLSVGQVGAEEASSITLRSFGVPEQKGGRWCRNSDETGVGDSKAGYAAVEVPTTVAGGLYEVRMHVWGESD